MSFVSTCIKLPVFIATLRLADESAFIMDATAPAWIWKSSRMARLVILSNTE
jgi:hypothetical protein